MGENSNRYKTHIKRINEELEGILSSRISLIEDIGNHTLLGNGKRLRPLFFVLSSLLCNYKGEDLYRLSSIFEYVHAASLLHDDVLDNAEVRRYRDSANHIWGNHAAILEGDFLASKSFCIATDSNNLAFLQRLSATTAWMAEGQFLELIQTNNWNTSKETYMEIITAKSAALLSAASVCGAIISGMDSEKEHSLEQFGLNVGIAFQLTDDLLDYTSSDEVMGKPVCKDLKEGKITLPLIYTLLKFEGREKRSLADLFINQQATDKDFMNLIGLVRGNGVLDRIRDEAQFYIKKAKGCLNAFPDSSIKRDLLRLAEYTTERKN
ncbi:polyprenyl synthetase family protein [Thermodesulfobacteriota bacterium]